MAQKNWNLLQYQRWQNQQYPNEAHGLEGDCINPKCDYRFTYEDIQDMEDNSGWFTCPNCGWSYNYLDETGGYTRAGLSLDQMGNIGESVVDRLGEIPNVGPVTIYVVKNHPIDGVAGQYGLEVKTNHSEAQPRFKIGGNPIYLPELDRTLRPREAKEYYCKQNGLVPALVGVRLNFYTDMADVFFREGLTDTWIGNPQLQHVGQVNFSDLNPFKDPQDVPPASELPDDDATPPVDDIPF